MRAREQLLSRVSLRGENFTVDKKRSVAKAILRGELSLSPPFFLAFSIFSVLEELKLGLHIDKSMLWKCKYSLMGNK